MSKEKLKILCIHGYRQSETTFRNKTGSLRKVLKSRAELTYITAPNLIPARDEKAETEGNESSTDPEYGWWFSKADSTYNAQEYTDCSSGFEKSVETVATAFEKHGPFDGVFAFSQGASLLSVICGMKEQGDKRFDFKFAIFVAGFHSRQKDHMKYYPETIKILSLHVIGETDRVIPREMSDSLLEIFSNATVLRHPGGHFVPTSGSYKQVYHNFLDQFR